MPMAEEFVNDDTEDRLRENDADAQIEATLFKQGQAYADRNKRSRDENKGRSESRAKIKELGMNPSAFAQAIKLIKDLTPTELKDWKRDFELTLKVMGSRQKDLFPMEQLKAEQRIQRAKDKAAGKPRSSAELDAAGDNNPNSDPKNGGAQVDIETAIAEATAREAAEGDALLQGKSDAWRDGFNAFGAGLSHADMPNALEGQDDWLFGYNAASQRAFDAAAPKVETPPPAPAAKPAKKSQTAKAADKRAAAQLPN